MTTAPKDWQAVAEEAILDHFRNPEHEPFHSDDLEHVIPDEHRRIIGLAVMTLVNKKLIVGCGYRKSAIPSRKRSPSQEYRLTELGRDRIAGVGGGFAATGSPPGGAATGPSPHSGDRSIAGIRTGDDGLSHASADPGESSSAALTGTAGEARPNHEPLTLLPEPDPEAWAA